MEESTGYYYTVQQQKVLTFLPSLPGILSIAGSLSVIYVILKDRHKKLKMVYQRLMLVMSVTDVIGTSGVTIMNGWAIPVGTEGFSGRHSLTATPQGTSEFYAAQGTSEFYGARGTVTTCNFAGMFLVFVNGSTGTYSLMLSFYYLLVLRYDMGERWIARYVEPAIHVLALLLPFILGASAWHYELLNPMAGWHGWCGLRDAPFDCSSSDDVECDRGGEHYLSYMTIMFYWVITGWLIITVDMILIVLKVRATEKRLVRYSIGHSIDTFKRTRQAGIQALLYIASYFVTFIFFILWWSPISNPTVLFALACLIKINYPMQGFWNALIYMRPYYKTYFEQKKKRRAQKENQRVSSVLSASINIGTTIGKACPPNMESSDKASSGEVPPAEVERYAFWNALIYMRPYSKTYSEQEKKRRAQKEIERVSSDISAVSNTTIGKACPPSMESSDEASGGEVPPAEVGRYAQRNPSGLFSRRVDASGRIVSIQSGTTPQAETLEEEGSGHTQPETLAEEGSEINQNEEVAAQPERSEERGMG